MIVLHACRIATILAVMVCLGFGLGAAAPKANAAELLMFEEDWCHWCERWNDEVGVIYGKTDEGRVAPLRRIDIHGARPTGVVLKSIPQFSPTFVLVHAGREIGRIEGYPGEDFFWGLLNRMLEKLPTSAKPNVSNGAAHN